MSDDTPRWVGGTMKLPDRDIGWPSHGEQDMLNHISRREWLRLVAVSVLAWLPSKARYWRPRV